MELKIKAVLDPQFAPMSLKVREMRELTKDNGQDIVIGVERNKGAVTTYRTRIFPDGTGHDEENYRFVERIVKSMLWVAGGFKIIIAGSDVVAQRIKEAYVDGGYRDFDLHFMENVYESKFEVVSVALRMHPRMFLPLLRSVVTSTVAVSALMQADLTARSPQLSTASPFILRKSSGCPRSTPTRCTTLTAFTPQ